jgi:hypothetical protein
MKACVIRALDGGEWYALRLGHYPLNVVGSRRCWESIASARIEFLLRSRAARKLDASDA